MLTFWSETKRSESVRVFGIFGFRELFVIAWRWRHVQEGAGFPVVRGDFPGGRFPFERRAVWNTKFIFLKRSSRRERTHIHTHTYAPVYNNNNNNIVRMCCICTRTYSTVVCIAGMINKIRVGNGSMARRFAKGPLQTRVYIYKTTNRRSFVSGRGNSSRVCNIL